MPDMELRIGIENEMYLEVDGQYPPEFKDKRDFEALGDYLVPFYTQQGGEALLRKDFSHAAHPGHYDDHNESGQWTITTDYGIGEVTLNDPPDLKRWPLEFVSPIFDFGPDSEWRKKVEDHWNTLSLLGEASVDALCATHVHISPKAGTRWNLDQLKQVAQAVIYFEEALKAILAPSRREHRLTKRNKANNRYLKDRGFGSCCELIQGRRNIDGLVSLLQPYQIASSQPKQDTPVNRAYAWNFENTKESKDEYQNPRIGTIEFRCAPGVTNAQHCLIWVELAVSFVQAAAQYGTETILRTYDPNSLGLRDFMRKAEVKGMNNVDLLYVAFVGSSADTDEELRIIFDEELKRLRL